VENYFNELNAVDVSAHVEKKGSFSYLSWAYAVAELKKRHPEASWRIIRYDSLPFLKTELGYFVEAEVCVGGVCHSQIHPVLNSRNQPIEKPTVFDINTSIQRALVKAIALHGLGLYIYAGEDLPEVKKAEVDKEASDKILACKSLEELKTVFESLTPEQRAGVKDAKDQMKAKLNEQH
jgi:hypothetical protein